ncbi:MAG: hypothetical protein HZA63_14035 [Rhodocyclales bacterium]|nr:hypothetical protein [Rhodocyclales bacterium]
MTVSKKDARACALAQTLLGGLMLAVAAHAAPDTTTPTVGAGPVVAYNEAVRIVNGKRVVQLPPLNPYNPKQFVPPANSHAMRMHAYMIETQAGLVQCTVPFFAKEGCEPSDYGRQQRLRTWVVFRNGEWQGCIGASKPKQCRAVYPKRGSPDHHLGGVIPSEVS